MVANKKMEVATVEEVANYLHCHPSTIRRLLKRHEIPGFRVGKRWRFKIDEIDAWCRRRTAVDRGARRG